MKKPCKWEMVLRLPYVPGTESLNGVTLKARVEKICLRKRAPEWVAFNTAHDYCRDCPRRKHEA